MNYSEFQDRYEEEANAEKQHYNALPVATLLRDIRARSLGEYYQIWYAVAERGTAAEAAGDLLHVLESNTDYLNRYHCATALISLAGLSNDGWQPEHLSGEPKFPVRENLRKIRALLVQRGLPISPEESPQVSGAVRGAWFQRFWWLLIPIVAFLIWFVAMR